MTQNIGIIDADLLDNGTRHPNLSLLKISGYHKQIGDNTTLVRSYDEDLDQYDHLYLAKVFDFSKVPDDVIARKNITIGGTGFPDGFTTYQDNPDPADAIQTYRFVTALPHDIEHVRPDYHLYDAYVDAQIAAGQKPTKYKDYLEFSIGFATRGCFRHCPFCVNHKSAGVRFHSHIPEWLDQSRKRIYLWDDNILAYPKWRTVFDELAATNKRFQFRQGMDIRLMTEAKADVLARAKYYGDYIFAYDHIQDAPYIIRGLKIWRNHTDRPAKLYVLTAYDSTDQNDIAATFERIKILFDNHAIPYIMRHENYQKSKYRGMYITLARWANQPSMVKKLTFAEYVEIAGGAAIRYAAEFKRDFPEIAAKYYTIRFH